MTYSSFPPVWMTSGKGVPKSLVACISVSFYSIFLAQVNFSILVSRLYCLKRYFPNADHPWCCKFEILAQAAQDDKIWLTINLIRTQCFYALPWSRLAFSKWLANKHNNDCRIICSSLPWEHWHSEGGSQNCSRSEWSNLQRRSCRWGCYYATSHKHSSTAQEFGGKDCCWRNEAMAHTWVLRHGNSCSKHLSISLWHWLVRYLLTPRLEDYIETEQFDYFAIWARKASNYQSMRLCENQSHCVKHSPRASVASRLVVYQKFDGLLEGHEWCILHIASHSLNQ